MLQGLDYIPLYNGKFDTVAKFVITNILVSRYHQQLGSVSIKMNKLVY